MSYRVEYHIDSPYADPGLIGWTLCYVPLGIIKTQLTVLTSQNSINHENMENYNKDFIYIST